MTGPWFRSITAAQWKTLLAAMAGWTLDATDFVIYLMAMPVLQAEFGFGPDTAGLLVTVSLLTSAAGGIFAVQPSDAPAPVRSMAMRHSPFRSMRSAADATASIAGRRTKNRITNSVYIRSHDSFQRSPPSPIRMQKQTRVSYYRVVVAKPEPRPANQDKQSSCRVLTGCCAVLKWGRRVATTGGNRECVSRDPWRA